MARTIPASTLAGGKEESVVAEVMILTASPVSSIGRKVRAPAGAAAIGPSMAANRANTGKRKFWEAEAAGSLKEKPAAQPA